MKIVHIETGRHFYGGAQQVIYLSSGLIECGIDSTIICPAESAIDKVARSRRLPVHNIPCAGDLDLVFFWRLRRYLAAHGPDLVHCHSRRGADFFGGWAARLAGVPAVLSRRVDSRESGFAARHRYALFHKVVAISDNISSRLRAAGFSADRMVTIRSAVDVASLEQQCKRSDWLRDFALREDHVVGVIAAQFIRRKGHRYALDAMAGLRETHPQFRMILFGSGPLEDELRDQVALLGLSEQVQFAGFRDDLDGLLACADMLIHPALKEGLGVAMLKAAAAGLPVVAFDIEGTQEAVVPNQTGLLVRRADVHSLLQAMTYLIDNPVERTRLGSGGQVRMKNSFSTRVMVNRHIDLYQATIGE